MNKVLSPCLLLILFVALLLPAQAVAKRPAGLYPVKSGMIVLIPDSAAKKASVFDPAVQDDKKQDTKKQDEKKQEGQNPEIKQVPKAKRQEMPLPLDTKIKLPIKRINPIIRTPVRIVRRTLGL
jgi:hypothetical protein